MLEVAGMSKEIQERIEMLAGEYWYKGDTYFIVT